MLICALNILYFRLKSPGKCSVIFWNLIHLYGMIGFLAYLCTREGDCLMRSEANQYEQSYRCLSTQQICQRLQYHSVQQKSLSVKILRATMIEMSSSYCETGDLHTASDRLILLLCSRAKSTLDISTWWSCLWCCTRIFLGIFLWFSMFVVVGFFWDFFNPRKMIPILSVSYELVMRALILTVMKRMKGMCWVDVWIPFP